MKMSQEEDTPEELRQMLQGMMKDLKKDFPEELEEFSAQEELDGDGVSLKEFLSQLKPPVGSKPRPPKDECPSCHREFLQSSGMSEVPMKCGHCLTTLRDVLRGRFAKSLEDCHQHSAEILGMPCFCKPSRGQTEKEKSMSDGERLVSLLKRYHAAVAAKNLDGAELLKEELNCLRRNLTEEMRRHATPASVEDVADFLALPALNGLETRDEFWRYGWLPSDGSRAAQIRLGSSLIFFRTIVDWPMPKEATAADYHRRLAEFLWQDPIFAGGEWIPKDYSLNTKNHRMQIDCGSSLYCQHRSFSFEGKMMGKPGEGGVLLKHLRAFLHRLEHRCTFFTDPEFGYFSPRREAIGSCIFPMEYLHLPALCMTEDILKLQKTVQAQDFSGCTDGTPSICLTTADGVPMRVSEPHGEAIGLVALIDIRSCGTPLKERFQNLNRVAKFLEKEEQQARRRLKANLLRHRRAEDAIARSLALLQNARLLTQEDALLAISRVWLGIELGCITSIPKQSLFEAARFALRSDNDLRNPLFGGRYKSEFVPTMPSIDYASPYLEDLDQLGDVLWEDQDPDMALPAKKGMKTDDSDPLGLGEMLGNLIDDPGRILEKLKSAFEERLPQESPEVLLERDRCNNTRAFMIRDILKSASDEFDWGMR